MGVGEERMNFIKMKKGKMILCFLCLLFLITACSNIEEENNQNTNNNESNKKNSSELCSDEIDEEENLFNSIIHKIWIVEDSAIVYNNISLYIDCINEDGVILGGLQPKSIAKPNFYWYTLDKSKDLCILKGEIIGSVIEANFVDETGNAGNVEITYINNDEIEVNVDYISKSEWLKNENLNGTFRLRPYEIKDMNNLKLLEEVSVDTNLEYWGDVKIIAGEMVNDTKIYPVSLIVNRNYEILYFFDASFQVGTRISKIIVEDKNVDGIKDIIIITDFIEGDEIESIERVFLQNSDGTFFNENLSDIE